MIEFTRARSVLWPPRYRHLTPTYVEAMDLPRYVADFGRDHRVRPLPPGGPLFAPPQRNYRDVVEFDGWLFVETRDERGDGRAWDAYRHVYRP
jgi:hypothetical protein